MKRKYYVVFIDSKRGIFKTWVEAKAATDHFSRPVHKVYGSWDEALAAWRLYTQKGGTILQTLMTRLLKMKKAAIRQPFFFFVWAWLS